MGGDEVDTAHWIPVELGEDVIATADDVGQVAHRACIALDKAADSVTEATIPDSPSVTDKGADLVQTCCIPCFCNDPGIWGTNSARAFKR